MTNEPSPRPWRVSETLGHAYIVQDARGSVVAHTETCALSVRPRHRADAALIVDAVNHMDYDLSIRNELNDARAEIDELRDIVKRMADKLEVHRGIFTASNVWSETGCHETCSLIREARAALGEDKHGHT